MLSLLGISLFAAGVVSTNPPDISGNWQGDDWGQVTLTQTAPGQYTGTYTDTVAKEEGPGKIDLNWSRIEQRFNGTWREGEDDRFGDLSIHLVDREVRGALTTDAKSKINPATLRLADLVWTRAAYRRAIAKSEQTSEIASKRIGVSLEWIELDCTPCPELAKRLQPDETRAVVVDRDDPKFANLEAKAAKRVLVNDVEWIEPGNEVNHTTRVNDENFELQLSLNASEKGNYEVSMRAARNVGTLLPASVKPGTQLTPEQMKEAKKGIQTTQMAFTLRLASGHSTAIGGLNSTPASENHKSRRKMLVLIVGLEKPEHGSVPGAVLPTAPAANASHPRAVQFDGSHFAKVEPPPKFTSGDFSISLWFNPVRSSHFAFPFMRGYSYRDQQGDIALKLNRDSGELDFQARTADHEWLFGWDAPESRLRSPVRYGQWNHAVVARRGDTYTMWMNGARVGSEKSSADISDAGNTNPFIMGGIMENNGVVDMFHGALDDFRVFRRCLSDKEIGTLYKSNGDETFLQGEGGVKMGPLCKSNEAAHNPETGQKQETKWTPENIKKDPIGYLVWAIEHADATKTRLEAAERALGEQKGALADKLRKASADKSNYETLFAELKQAYEKAVEKNHWPVSVGNQKFDSSSELKRKIVECDRDLKNAAKLVETYSTAKGKVTDRLDEIDVQRAKNETLRIQLETDFKAAKVKQALEGIGAPSTK